MWRNCIKILRLIGCARLWMTTNLISESERFTVEKLPQTIKKLNLSARVGKSFICSTRVARAVVSRAKNQAATRQTKDQAETKTDSSGKSQKILRHEVRETTTVSFRKLRLRGKSEKRWGWGIKRKKCLGSVRLPVTGYRRVEFPVARLIRKRSAQMRPIDSLPTRFVVPDVFFRNDD